MKDQLKDTVDIEVQSGGVLEFEKAGEYPEYLIVTSKKWGRRWRKSISGDKKEGVLYINKNQNILTESPRTTYLFLIWAVEIESHKNTMAD